MTSSAANWTTSNDWPRLGYYDPFTSSDLSEIDGLTDLEEELNRTPPCPRQTAPVSPISASSSVPPVPLLQHQTAPPSPISALASALLVPLLLERLRPLSKEEQLRELMDILRNASSAVESGMVMAVIACRHLSSTELWRVNYGSMPEFRYAIGWEDEVRDLVEGGKVLHTARLKTESKLQSHWQCSLEDLFSRDEVPASYSKHFLQSLSSPVGLCSREEGLRKIRLSVKKRHNTVHSRSCDSITAQDVGLAVRLLKAELQNKRSTPVEARTDSDAVPTPGQKKSSRCNCSLALRGQFSADCWRRSPVPMEDVEVAWIAAGKGSRFCHRHLRIFTGRGLNLFTNRRKKTLLHRARAVQACADESELEQLRRDQPHWFRARVDQLSLWRFQVRPQTVFVCDAEKFFESFAGVGSWNTWLRDGNIIIPDFFKYLFTNDITRRIKSEYDAYRYHTQLDFHGKARNGWTRTMFYSLIQQLVRQDPGYYAIMAAARPDQNWRLISYPYYTKDTIIGESTGFKHLNLNVPALLESGRGANIIQTTLSLDDEDEDGCTILVPGFHRHIREWWARVEARGIAADGLTTNVSQKYTKEDQESFGSFVPVPCKRGGVRISRPELIHGSTSVSTKRRKTLFVWHCGIQEDHVTLDNKESETWDELARCHRHMDTPRSSTSGHGFAYGKPTCRFPAATRLASTSAIGDALIGVRRWDEPGVIHERNIVLGLDTAAAKAYIMETRSKLLRQYRIAYDIKVKTEKSMFGAESYFADAEDATARAARQPASDYDSQSTNAFSNDGDPADDDSE